MIFLAVFNSWFHICFWAQYLNRELPGVALGRPFTYRKGELHIPLQGHTHLQSLHLTLQAPLPYFMVEDNLPRPRERVPVLSAVDGYRIMQVRMHRNDRQLLIGFAARQGYLLWQLFGINGNVFYLDHQFKVQAAFKSSRRKALSALENFIMPDEALRINKKSIEMALRQKKEQKIKAFLKSLPIPIYPRELHTEIRFRSGLDLSQYIINLNQMQQTRLAVTTYTVLQAMQKPSFLVYQTTPPVLSFMILTSLDSDYVSCENVRMATLRYISDFFKRYKFSQKRKNLQRHLARYIDRLERKLKRQEKDYHGLPSAEDYKIQADTLLANLHRLDGKVGQVNLPRVDNPEQTISIDLDVRLAPAKNAEKLYGKAKKIRQSKAALTKSIQQSQSCLAELKQKQSALQAADNWMALEKIERTLPSDIFQYPQAPQDYERLPYHLFYYQNWEILVGKGAQDNDTLTFQVANPMDFWMHAQQVPGSHVIVRNPEKKKSLPRDVLIHAAAIAAGYSQAKHAGLVPVVYTKKKYVRKRKSMPPGKVFMQFEKTVFAEPLRPSK